MAVTQYIGSRYVPIFADPVEWSSAKEYEPLTIVLHEGNSFTSKQFVPVGVDIDNETYWAVTGNYNAQVEQYRRDTAIAKATANAAQTDIDTLLPKTAFSSESTVKQYIDSETSQLASSIDVRALTFDTIVDMKASDKLYDGAICHTNGFYASNDGGAATYKITTSGIADDITVFSCQNNLYAHLQATDFVSAKMFGCKGDSNTDNTKRMQTMLDYGAYNVYINSGTYVINDTLTVNEPRNIYGAGTYSKLMVTESFDTTKAAVQIAATNRTNPHESSYHIHNFAIVPSDFSMQSAGSGNIGGIGVEILVSVDGSNNYLNYFQNNLTIENMYIARLGNVGIFFNNTNAYNGFFSCVIRNNNIFSGLKTNRFGDGDTIHDNFFQGVGEIYLDGIAGATSNSEFRHNIVTCGCIHLATGARNFVIADNQIELLDKSDLTQSAAILVESSFSTVRGNNINCLGSNINCVELIQASRCSVKDNLMVADSGKYWIYAEQSSIVRASGNYPSTSTGGISSENRYYTSEFTVITGVTKPLTINENDYVTGSANFIVYDNGMLEIYFNLTAKQDISSYVTVPTNLHSFLSRKGSGNISNILYCGADNVRVDFQTYDLKIGGNENRLPSGHGIKGNIVTECIPF